MRKILGLLLTLAANLLISQAAHAQLITAKDPSSIVRVLQNKGYRAELTKDETGDPMIRSASSGTDFLVMFYNCKENRNCATVQFYSGFSEFKNGSVAAINEWNAKNRFGRAYVSDKGTARLEMDLDLDDGGMSLALFEDNIEFWVAILANFEKHLSGG